jgi:hypothetical protein
MIEVEVAPRLVHQPGGVVQRTVIVTVDGPLETLTITVLIKETDNLKADEKAAIQKAKQLAVRFCDG